MIEGEGRRVLEQMRRGRIGPPWSGARCTTERGVMRLYLGCDGVKIALATEEEKKERWETVKAKRRRRGRKCKPLPPAQPGAGCVYKEFRVRCIDHQSKRHRSVQVTSRNYQAAGRMSAPMADQVQWKGAGERVAWIDGGPVDW